MEQVQVKPKVNECPYCHHELGASSPVSGGIIPRPGDNSVCYYCAGLLVFTAPNVVRALTDDEYQALHPIQRAFLDEIAEHVRRYQASRKVQR